jgi:hypothetical protein
MFKNIIKILFLLLLISCNNTSTPPPLKYKTGEVICLKPNLIKAVIIGGDVAANGKFYYKVIYENTNGTRLTTYILEDEIY